MTLKLHLDPSAITGVAEGGAVATFPDVSGWGRDHVQTTPSAQPTFSTSGIAGRPGVRFNGTSTEMQHGAGSLADYLGASAGAWIVVVQPTAIAAPGSTSTWDSVCAICDLGGFWGVYLRDTPETRVLWYDGVGFGGTEKHLVLAAALGTPLVVAGYYQGGQLYAAVNALTFSSVAAGPLADLTSRPVLGRSHHGPILWLDGLLGDILLWDEVPDDFLAQVQGQLNRYQAAQPAGQASARNVASRFLRRFRRPVPQPRISVPLHRGLVLEPGQLVTASHRRLPARGAASAGAAKGERFAGRIAGKTTNPAGQRVQLQLREWRPVRLWYRPLVTLSGSAQQEGVALVLSGQTWTFTRPTAATINDPGGGGSVSIPANIPRIDAGGHYFTAGDRLLVSNDASARLWPAERGSVRILGAPDFDSADVAGDVVPFLAVDYDSDNHARLVYNGPSGEWQYRRTRAGVTTTASVAATLVQGEPFDLVARWTGPAGELGLDPYSASLVVDGVAGAPATAAGPPVETAISSVEIFGGDGASAESWLRAILITPDVLTDEESARED